MAKKIDFDKMPKAEQRVVIAKDLITRLAAEKFVANSHMYFRVSIPHKELRAMRDTRQVRSVLRGRKCRGCQIGGMFLCAVDRHNAITMGEIRNITDVAPHDMNEYLHRWFSQSVLDEVEKAFEGWGEYDRFRLRVPHHRERMRMVAQNIIDNKGRFVGRQLR